MDGPGHRSADDSFDLPIRGSKRPQISPRSHRRHAQEIIFNLPVGGRPGDTQPTVRANAKSSKRISGNGFGRSIHRQRIDT